MDFSSCIDRLIISFAFWCDILHKIIIRVFRVFFLHELKSHERKSLMQSPCCPESSESVQFLWSILCHVYAFRLLIMLCNTASLSSQRGLARHLMTNSAVTMRSGLLCTINSLSSITARPVGPLMIRSTNSLISTCGEVVQLR